MELKEIPGTLGFLADDFGNIYNPDLTKRNTYKNGDGYVTASVKTINGCWVTFGVQRLVALSHLLHEKKEETTEVNHRDSDVENNAKENLEWVTPSQNNIHSEIMRMDNLYPTIIGYKDDVAFALYKNAHEVAGYLNVSVLDVWDSIKDSKLLNGVTLIHKPFDGCIPNSLKKQTSPYKDKRAIKTLDVDTGDIKIFESFHVAGKEYNTSPSHLYQSISQNGKVKLFRKKYQVAYVNDDFPEINEEDLINAKQHGAKEVIAYNFNDELYYIHSSAKEFIIQHSLSKKAVTTSLAAGILRRIDSFVVVYFSKENVLKLKAFIEGPAIIKALKI